MIDTDFRCKHCDRPMWRKGTPLEDRPAGSILHSGHGACTTCYHRLYTVGGLTRDDASPVKTGTPREHWDSITVDMSWHDKGRCNDDDVDAELFFHPEKERGAKRTRRAEAAKAVCRACPVMGECRSSSLETREPHGTWGGLSELERAALLEGRPMPVARPRRTRQRVTPDLAPLVLTVPAVPRSAMGRRTPAGPVIDHMRRLYDTGYSLNEIARTAGLHHTSLGALMSEVREDVTERTATLVLGTRPTPDAESVAA